MAETTNFILKTSSVRHNNLPFRVSLTIKELGSCSVSHITQRLDLSKTAISKAYKYSSRLGTYYFYRQGQFILKLGGKRPEHIFDCAKI